ncbi:MAG: HypC/HybG/HupF family hydrogenase formation chaperone [Actinomycetota bacterium]
MCLGIPGRVVEKHEQEGLLMGVVDFGGVRRTACLAYLPEIEIGEYTIIHAGFGISRLDEDEARQTLELLAELGEAEALAQVDVNDRGEVVSPAVGAEGRQAGV